MTTGQEWVWVPDGQWRLLGAGDTWRCRRRCGAFAVAQLLRSRVHRVPGGLATRSPQWWAYCVDHLYGRRIANGQVEVEVHPNSLMAQWARK